jgi:hypothetical protein
VVKISVRLGEPYWRHIEAKRVSLELPEGSRVNDMLRVLGEQYPVLQPCLNDAELAPTVFLGDALVSESTRISEGDEPAILWALSGG